MQCACTSEKFRFKFSKAGGLKYLQFQLHEASNDEFNKVSINKVSIVCLQGKTANLLSNPARIDSARSRGLATNSYL